MIVAVVLATVLAFVLMNGNDDEDEVEEIDNVEASTDGIKVGDVMHSPENPIAGDHVEYYGKVEGVPSGYTVMLLAQYYDGDKLTEEFSGTMLKVSGITYKDIDVINDDKSGITIKYKIMIFEQDWREEDDLIEDFEPILESDLHSFIIL